MKLAPQKATLSKAVPAAGEWLFEIKLDGYRLMARIEGGKVRLITSGGHDWTSKMLPLAEAVSALGLQSAWLDGEVVALNAEGRPDFSRLQDAFDSGNGQGLVYYLFDAPFLGGYDLRRSPLHARRELLRQVVETKGGETKVGEGRGGESLRFSADFSGDAPSVLKSACELKLEGIIAKRRDAPYVSDRTTTWLKLKCSERQEFVIVGFTDRSGTRSEVGGLLLGYHDEAGALRYGGSVGTGWNTQTARDLRQRLAAIETQRPAVDARTLKPGRWSRRAAGTEHWVKPLLVAEVSFTEWTPEGHARHPVFQGLRADKPAAAITQELAAAVNRPAAPRRPSARKASARKASAARAAPTVKVSNAGRVIDASTGLTKLDLVRYYEGVAQWMLPHLAQRPVSLVRGPTGIGGELFFQKHDDKLSIPGIRTLDASLWPGYAALLEVPSAQALVNAAQMNVIEFHTWNSTTRCIDKPDRVIFDLDPGENVPWVQMQEAALLTHTLLTELRLQSWLKTSGGKGLHVVVPLSPRLDYASVERFSEAVTVHLARTIPARFVARSGARNRVGRIFVDYLRNGHSQTTAAAFSARARAGLGVSMPVAWEQLDALEAGDQWSIATALGYLAARKADPWSAYWKCRQTLTAALKSLGG